MSRIIVRYKIKPELAETKRDRQLSSGLPLELNASRRPAQSSLSR